MKERLQKIIAAAGLASRRQAEEWITAGRVTVNKKSVKLGDQADPAIDRIEVDGRPLGASERKMYVLLHKPAGYVVSLKDPQGRPVVTDLLAGLPARLFPVGRLDYNTEGLLLLTNDGELAQRLAHPSHEIGKTYLVKVRGHLGPAACERLAKGVLLDDGPTAPARIDRVRGTTGHTWFEITIHEGRNRQVRRMCEAIGHPVARLKRIRLGFLELGDLPSGEYRQLTPGEVQRLKNS
jgi:23S rRNA pseudouridine2605 synthase